MTPALPDPILRDFPDQLATERLLIRPLRPGDGPAINAAIRSRWRSCGPGCLGADTSCQRDRAHCRHKAAEWLRREDLMLTLWRRSDGLFVG